MWEVRASDDLVRRLKGEGELVKKTKPRIQDGRNQKSGKSPKLRRKAPRQGHCAAPLGTLVQYCQEL